MNKTNLLALQAVAAAKRGDWPAAIEKNQQLLDINSKDLGAYNRLGTALLQQGEVNRAKTAFKAVLDIDSSNQIARKHLQGINSKQTAKKPSFSSEQFIEEPGTTKIVELHRLANKSLLNNLCVGQTCLLVCKNRYISVETSEGEYIGALPEDLSYRLSKLMKRANRYEALVHSANEKECHIYIKEVFRSKKNESINSFPLNRTNLSAINDVDERFLLEDNIPVAIVNTDEDSERSLDDVDTQDD